MDLKTADMLSLQTGGMRSDRTTQALCAALEPLWRDVGGELGVVLIYPRIDRLTGAVLDELAWQFHADAYDATASDEEKRRILKSNFTIHKYKGSVYAVKEAVSAVFGARAEISEWFDYGGSPYHFKVEVYCIDRGAGEADIRRAEQLVSIGKNLRSVLDEIRLILVGLAQPRIVAASIQSETVSVYPKGASR